MLLENVVVPFLEVNKLEFLKRDATLLVPIRGSDSLDIHIKERTDPPSLHIIVSGLAAFPADDGYVPKLLMELNSVTLGKWLTTEDGEVLFVLEILPYEGFSEEAFKVYFDRAIGTGVVLKEKLLAVRYGGMTLQRALRSNGNSRTDKSKKTVKRLIEQALGDG